MSIEFQHVVVRELDQIRAAFERAIERLEARDEDRDEEVSELKLQVGLLRAECRRNIKRDAGLVLAPTTIVTVIQAVMQYWTPPPPAPPQKPVPVETRHP